MQILILAILLGALVGLRNEIVYVKKGQSPIGGFRSFIFIAILGYLAGIIYTQYTLLSLLISGFMFSLVLLYYTKDLKRENKLGLTMELSAILVYLSAFLLTTSILPARITVAITILVAFLLANQKSLRHLLFAFKEEEVTQIALFATLTFVILPFLPNHTFSILEILPKLSPILSQIPSTWQILLTIPLINPFKLWWIVVLVSGIEVLGYVIARIVGQTTSIITTSLISGFISSTSSTIAFAQQAKQHKNKLLFASAILLANAVSFLEIYLLVAPVSTKFLNAILLPNTILLITLGIGGIITLIIAKIKNTETTKHESKQKHTMFDLKFALSFALLLGIVQIVTRIAYVLFGNIGFLATSALAGFSGINAVVLNTAILLQNGSITTSLALQTFLIVNIVNLLAKAFYIQLTKQSKITVTYLFWVFIAVLLAFIAIL